MKYSAILFLLFLSLPVFSQDYVMVWHDEFNTPGLPDSTMWGYEVGKVRNTELQYYTYRREENARIEDTVLIIEARKEDYKGSEYTSASLISKMKGDWKYGKIEISAKVPTGKGTWPALWMMPTYSEYGGWPKSGEIDIMEYIGVEPEHLFYTVHYEGTDGSGHESTGSGGTSGIQHPWEKFINFTLVWTPDSLIWYADGVKYHSYAKTADDYRVWPFDKKFYLILNLAYGGAWGGYAGVDDSKLPHQFLIDYVRVYQLREGPGPYSLNIQPASGGSVEVSPEMSSYPDGTQVTLTALPDSSFIFKGWLHQGAANPYTFNIRKDMTVLPFFLRKNELLTNSTFDEQVIPWSKYESNGQAGNSDLYISNGELVSDILNSPGVNWEIGFQESGIPVPAGYYRITFDARAENPEYALVTLARNYGNWGSYFNWNRSVGTDMQSYTIDFHMAEGDANCRLFFGTGNFTGKIWFDNISLVKIEETAQKAVLDKHVLHLIQGQSDSLSLSVTNQFGEPLTGFANTDATWKVTGDAGTVSPSGSFYATGDSPGGWIISSYGGKADSCQVFVQQISEIQIDKDTLFTDSLRNVKFNVQTLGVDDKPLNIGSDNYNWSVSTPAQGSVDGDGWFRGSTSGTTMVYVSYNDFYDSARVFIECGHEHLKIEKFIDPASWSAENTSLENLAIDTATTSSGLKVLDADYSYSCNAPNPVFTLGKPLRVYGLPDSLWLEFETGEDSIRPSIRIRKHGGEEIWLEGPAVLSAVPVLTGLPASFDDIDYPLTVTALRFDVVTNDQSCQAGETINGKLRIRKLLASYPGHAPFYADEDDNTLGVNSEKATLRIFPNPSHDVLRIMVPGDFAEQNTQLFVYRIDGTLQHSRVIHDTSTTIDVSNWPSGTYFVRAIAGHFVLHGRLVIL